MGDPDYITCEDCGSLVPENNLVIHQARACEARARPLRSDECTHSVPLPQPRRRNNIEQHRGRHQESRFRDGHHRNVPIDQTNEADNPPSRLEVPSNMWSCSRCTLFNTQTRRSCEACQQPNPDVRHPDPVRREQLIHDDFGSWGNTRNSNNPNSSLLHVGGGAILGSVLGAAAFYVRGRPVTDGAIEGAMGGAIGGALVDSLLSHPHHNSRQGFRFAATPDEFSGMSSSPQLPREFTAVLTQLQEASDGSIVVASTRSDGITTQHIFGPGDDGMRARRLRSLLNDAPGIRGRYQLIDGMGYEQLLRAFGNGTENMGASESDIKSLPISTISNVEKELPEGNARQCCICLDDFQSGDKRKTLPCRHGYHPDCIDKALRTRARCPICNATVKG